ncbi:MAG TPA: hypothetical protein DCY31_06375 [Ruminococcaceae bacterium]|nr:hypothetical protein [Oscillospiraceae bacterium]
MKKIFFIIPIICIIMLCSCSAASDETPNEGTATEVTNPKPYTTVIDGKKYTAQKIVSGNNDYQIGYYDESGRGVRLDYYKDGKLSYYYISSDFDENGNDTVQKYYDKNGKLIATVDPDGFYDADGRSISETELDALLPS